MGERIQEQGIGFIKGAFKTMAAGVAVFALGVACSTSPKPEVAPPPAGPEMLQFQPGAVNSEVALNRPYVVLLSIDGYRHDYNRMYAPPNLTAIASEGVAAEGLRPIYPSKTFPNHYSIVTGLYADRHGIVSNDFYDPDRKAGYTLGSRSAVEDGTWYLGEPIWITAGKQGMLSASFFWVGSEANIQDLRPNYYFRYNESVANEARVDQVIEWLKMPPEKRPHLITLYMSDVDSAGHKFGPDSAQTREAVLKVDSAVGRLRDGLAKLRAENGLAINLVVVSDHGMEALDSNKVILIDEAPEIANLLSRFRIVGRGPSLQLYLNPGEDKKLIQETEDALEKRIQRPGVYRVLNRVELKSLHFSQSPRVGDLVIEADAPWSLGLKAHPPSTTGGNHGWNAVRAKNMNGIFYAEGPGLRPKARLPVFENIHVAPLVLDLLGLKAPAGIDGKLSVTRSAVKPMKATATKSPLKVEN